MNRFIAWPVVFMTSALLCKVALAVDVHDPKPTLSQTAETSIRSNSGLQSRNPHLKSECSLKHHQNFPDQFRCVQFVRNYDGDTLTVNIPGAPEILGKKISVRVKSIDTPEIKGKGACEKPAARKAKNFVSSKLKTAQQVHLLNVERDKYFRILADVEVDGQDLKSLLIQEKLAVGYDGGRKAQVNWCQRLGLKEDR